MSSLSKVSNAEEANKILKRHKRDGSKRDQQYNKPSMDSAE